jgi:glycosyltransferase involved in cell wall biosynthesis
MKIAMIGQRGIPATYGGIERHVEELSAALVARGHEVTVFTRPQYTDPDLGVYRGVRLASLPTVPTKHLDAIVHSVLASFAVWRGGYDIVHYHATGPCLASPIAKLRGCSVVATIHGQDWRRGKWGWLASLVLRVGEWLALHVPVATIVVSETLAADYRHRASSRIVAIPNGVSVIAESAPDVLDELGVSAGRYVLFVGRIVPEKDIETLVRAYVQADVDWTLVIAGAESHTGTYCDEVHDLANGMNVVFAGYRYGAELATLYRDCGVFVLPSLLEGLPIVLLEALAYSAQVIASDIPPNREVLVDKGHLFAPGDVDSLARLLKRAEVEPGSIGPSWADSAAIVEGYSWVRVTEQVEQVYEWAIRS